MMISSIHPEVQALLAKGHPATFRKGEVIVRPENANDAVYFLKSGLVKAFVLDNSGEERIHAIYRPGDFFSLVLAINDIRFNIFFGTISECQVVRIPKDVFISSLQSNAELSFEVLKRAIDVFATYIARVDNLEYKFARERLAYRLLLLARKLGVEHDNVIGLPHLSQYEIGSTINLSRESVSRELSRFERLNYITNDSGCIVIKDKAGLRRELGSNNYSLFVDDET